MKRVILLLSFFVLIGSGTANAQYDPYLFQVVPETSCYLACPSGDASFCFCIRYDGEPLYAPISDVFMTIECVEGCLHLCPAECLDKCSYLKSNCIQNPGFGSEFCWFFRIGGCCTEAHITLHMKNDPTPFYEADVAIKTPDFDCDGDVDDADQMAILGALGTSSVCHDLDCSGIVDAADVAIFQMHYIHECNDWIGAESASWGKIKKVYE